MKFAEVRTRCECQGWLSAQVDEAGRVTAGAVRKGRSAPENAPATAIGAGQAHFDVGWLCPLCGRNTLRSFDRAGLTFREFMPPNGAAAE
jgi:hypothetical protein